jgi:hypothetical protein
MLLLIHHEFVELCGIWSGHDRGFESGARTGGGMKNIEMRLGEDYITFSFK